MYWLWSDDRTVPIKMLDLPVRYCNGTQLTFIKACLFGMFQRTNIPNVGDRITISSRTSGIDLIEFVIHNQPFLPRRIQNPTLVRIGCAFIRGDGNDGRVGLIRDIIYGQCILVVSITDISTEILLVRTAIRETLGIMDIAVLAVTTHPHRFTGIFHIDENEASGATIIPRTRPNSHGVFVFFVDDNIVGRA